MATPKQVKGALEVIKAIADTIKELGTVPSGHLYAQLMGTMSLETYNGLMRILKDSGVVSESSSHLLTWKGGK